MKTMKTGDWINDYVIAHKAALDSLPTRDIERVALELAKANTEGKQIFVLGNGGSAANASHFITDLGKGASDVLDKRFRCLSLTDNLPWISAIGNDYAYEDIFLRQLQNFAQAGDIVLAASVSGNSPNLVKAFAWAKDNGLKTVALVSANGGKLADIAESVLPVDSSHYGIVEDCHMTIYHILCYAFIEKVITL